MVVSVGKQIVGLMDFGFLGCHLNKGHDDEFIAHLSFSRRGTIETDDSCTTFTFDDVSFEAFAVVVVDDEHFLVGYHSGGVDEIFIYGNATGVVKFCLCETNVVDFCL